MSDGAAAAGQTKFRFSGEMGERGPLDAEQVGQLVREGKVFRTTIVQAGDDSQWTPAGAIAELAAFFPPLQAAPPSPPPPAYAAAATAPPAPPFTSPAPAPFGQRQASVGLEYAGFWIRLAAALIDGLIVSAITFIALMITVTVFGDAKGEISTAPARIAMNLVSVGVAIYYYGRFLSSDWQATLKARR
jgi:hypothetical protein